MRTALPTGTLKVPSRPVKTSSMCSDALAAPELLTVDEVAALLRVTPKGIYAMTSGRRIPFVRVSNRVRFRRDEIERWLDGHRVEAIARAK